MFIACLLIKLKDLFKFKYFLKFSTCQILVFLDAEKLH